MEKANLSLSGAGKDTLLDRSPQCWSLYRTGLRAPVYCQ